MLFDHVIIEIDWLLFILPSVIPPLKVVRNLYCEFYEIAVFCFSCSMERNFQKSVRL